MSVANTLPTPEVSRQKTKTSQNASEAGTATVARPFSLRGFTSMLLVLCVLMVLISGAVLFLAPRGRVANWTDWTVLSLGRPAWIALHINSSLLFIVVTFNHLVLNWSRLVGYLKKPSRPKINMKKELAAALAVTATIFAATIYNLPPISLPVELRYELRDSWEQVEPRVGEQSLTKTTSR